MTNEDLEAYFYRVGFQTETITGADNQPYIVIPDYRITAGSLAGRVCDVAIHRTPSIPYVFPSAIHTRPALVPMDMNRYRTLASGIGPEWQCWSRVLRTHPPTPRSIVMHIATIFSEV